MSNEPKKPHGGARTGAGKKPRSTNGKPYVRVSARIEPDLKAFVQQQPEGESGYIRNLISREETKMTDPYYTTRAIPMGMNTWLVEWQLPNKAFYGTAQGRTLDSALDAIPADERCTVWHLTIPGDHFLFRNEADTRAFLQTYIDRNGLKRDLGKAETYSTQDPSYDTQRARIWQHTTEEECARNKRIKDAFDAVCAEARKSFENVVVREAYNFTSWTDFLNPAAKAHLAKLETE